MPSLDQLQKLLSADPTDPFVPYAMAMDRSASIGTVAEQVITFAKLLG